jgi:hypothetical protein
MAHPKSKSAAAAASPKKKAAKATTTKKSSTPYNIYMKKALEDLKRKFPDMPHKQRFKEAAMGWANDPSNPSKKK